MANLNTFQSSKCHQLAYEPMVRRSSKPQGVRLALGDDDDGDEKDAKDEKEDSDDDVRIHQALQAL